MSLRARSFDAQTASGSPWRFSRDRTTEARLVTSSNSLSTSLAEMPRLGPSCMHGQGIEWTRIRNAGSTNSCHIEEIKARITKAMRGCEIADQPFCSKFAPAEW
jgi:hypothetical protein